MINPCRHIRFHSQSTSHETTRDDTDNIMSNFHLNNQEKMMTAQETYDSARNR